MNMSSRCRTELLLLGVFLLSSGPGLLAAEQGRRRKLRFDTELLYVASSFHDLGLIKKFSSPDERFEVDGANAARQFLNAHNIAEDQVQAVDDKQLVVTDIAA